MVWFSRGRRILHHHSGLILVPHSSMLVKYQHLLRIMLLFCHFLRLPPDICWVTFRVENCLVFLQANSRVLNFWCSDPSKLRHFFTPKLRFRSLIRSVNEECNGLNLEDAAAGASPQGRALDPFPFPERFRGPYGSLGSWDWKGGTKIFFQMTPLKSGFHGMHARQLGASERITDSIQNLETIAALRLCALIFFRSQKFENLESWVQFPEKWTRKLQNLGSWSNLIKFHSIYAWKKWKKSIPTLKRKTKTQLHGLGTPIESPQVTSQTILHGLGEWYFLGTVKV